MATITRQIKPSELTDEMTNIRVIGRFDIDYTNSVYDDSWGQLFVYRHSLGIGGIVRARTWEDAWSICEDEFFDSATWEDVKECYDSAEEYAAAEESGELPEGFGFRPNGPNSMPGDVGIYSEDLNGTYLDELTDELAAELELTITVDTPEWSVVVGNIGTVYSGISEDYARKHYAEYVTLSRLDTGLVSGESVVLMHDDDIVAEHYGTTEDE